MSIKLESITKTFGTGDALIRAVDGVSIEIEKGDFISIMGPSGCGKTTLLNMIGLMDVPTSGSYYLDDENVLELGEEGKAEIRSKKLSFIFQNFALMDGYSVYDNVILPLFNRRLSKSEKMEKASKALEILNIQGLLKKNVNLLSGGQKQRVAIARSLVTEAEYLLADEPTGALDSENSENLMKLLTELNERGKTIILITHDPKVASYAKTKLFMRDGKIIDGGRMSENDKNQKKTK